MQGENAAEVSTMGVDKTSPHPTLSSVSEQRGFVRVSQSGPAGQIRVRDGQAADALSGDGKDGAQLAVLVAVGKEGAIPITALAKVTGMDRSMQTRSPASL